MQRLNTETAVGILLVAGFLCFAYLSVRLGEVELFSGDDYTVTARFRTIAGLKEGALVEVAGVRVGKVDRITLDQEYYEAVVTLAIRNGVDLPEDSIASIRTSGIIGDRYVKISPGGAPDLIGPGGEIVETESAIIIEELISKYIFEQGE